MDELEWNDIQGLVRRGYNELKHAAYVLWRFKLERNQEEVGRWIAELAEKIARADSDDPTRAWDRTGGPRESSGPCAINLALTASGLSAVGVTDDELAYFSTEFRDGMAPKPEPADVIPRRSNLLGDLDHNSPYRWAWGGWGEHCHVDGLLLLFAETPGSLKELIREQRTAMDRVAEVIPIDLEGRFYEDSKEHFGFRDGLSNPLLSGTDRCKEATEQERRISEVAPGEFVLGYPNERGDRVSHRHGSGGGDLGRNGTYLVFRQLEQHVAEFRTFIKQAAKLSNLSEARVAACMVGRTYEGEPLIPAPAISNGAGAPANSGKESRPRNDFLYYFEDRFGVACPLGAHIRRANPRDLIGPDPDTALRLSRMHRIIRRGRTYGDRVPADTLDDDRRKRGLNFICLNANIAGQFEFVQHTWLNNRHFNRLYDEADAFGSLGGHAMTVQDRPTNVRIDNLPQFVTVRGGAYFFMPGISALRSLGARNDAMHMVA